MRTQSLFEIAVPMRDNEGKAVPEGRHFAFENFLMHHAGGYTAMTATDGAWRDGDGHVYLDKMRAYRVACEAETMRALVQCAFKIYADQKAIFVAEIGRAWIVPANLAEGQLDRYTHTAGKLADV